MPKVTRRGGGSALPWKRKLFGDIVRSAVEGAAGMPVTIKMRIGIDDDHRTMLDAGRIAQDAGVAWVALHARTAAQRYSGEADWSAIAELKQALDIPVLGNGDIWEAEDALRVMSQTGCDGVVIGRGCLGRPWLFADLHRLPLPHPAHPGRGRRPDAPPRDTAGRMVGREKEGVTDFRKHVAWYLKGFPAGGELRAAMATSSSLAELGELLAQLDPCAT